MSHGTGRFGWTCYHPWHYHWWHHCHGGPDSYYDWGVGSPYRAPWVSKDQETAMLEDEAKALEEELSQIKKRLQEIRQ